MVAAVVLPAAHQLDAQALHPKVAPGSSINDALCPVRHPIPGGVAVKLEGLRLDLMMT
jgi:hypothetical protein